MLSDETSMKAIEKPRLRRCGFVATHASKVNCRSIGWVGTGGNKLPCYPLFYRGFWPFLGKPCSSAYLRAYIRTIESSFIVASPNPLLQSSITTRLERFSVTYFW